MAPRAKAASGGGHTSGIFADMTVDGPVIGTLVVIVDKAKNLPNRKSMGKQDPYCAARLGKEAKKTETDRRGGQTPKWDQELRFTVHESPDYYHLKVSLFNDDKKTELIGETRIGLEDIIMPGGGKNDTWHHLHCKGRFAGEIRIELTYYDTRPKEDRTVEGAADTAMESSRESTRDASGGPRGPKPLKRRPLPANPTGASRPGMAEHAHSSPLPQPTQPFIHQPIPSHPESYQRSNLRLESTPPLVSQDYYSGHSIHNGPPNGHIETDPYWGNGNNGGDLQDYNDQFDESQLTQDAGLHMPSYQAYNGYHQQHAPVQPPPDLHGTIRHNDSRPSTYRTDTQFADYSSVEPYEYEQPPIDHGAGGSYGNVYSQSPPTMAHGNSTSGVRPATDPRLMGQQSQRHSLPSGRAHSERSPVHQRSQNDGAFDPYLDQHRSVAADGVPPPPPAHRSNSGISPSPLGSGRSHSESCAPLPGTAPLTIRKERGSISNSPLSQVQTSRPYTDLGLSASPSVPQDYAHNSAMTTSRHVPASTAPRDAYHRRSMSPTRNGHAMPASLVPGYEPPSRNELPQQVASRQPMHHYQYSNSVSESAPEHQSQQGQQHRPLPQHAATINTQSPLQALERGPNQRPHRASAPVPDPRAVSPDRRVPPRKSVSPQPEMAPSERRNSGIPFGPDSYDALNPFAGSGGTSPGARYKNPEQAREAALQHEREKQLGSGPIIGSDGKEIDPSDHLPTDTWAPEPESKVPKKTAQVNFRFRNSPQGAQPMPPSSRRGPHDASARPASISTPGYSTSPNNNIPYSTSPNNHVSYSTSPSAMPDNISPTTAARARLQKRTRVSPAQPNSSPIVPTMNTTSQNPVLRSSASDYPLREHENYGSGNSPGYGRHPPAHAPPVPGKVPLGTGMGQEDWRRDPLSEELSRIDIGVGGGSRGRRWR
ncbi:MAG: hypothetical protein Q9174_003640 [Haloplaca sp. 1 TL-2023]